MKRVFLTAAFTLTVALTAASCNDAPRDDQDALSAENDTVAEGETYTEQNRLETTLEDDTLDTTPTPNP